MRTSHSRSQSRSRSRSRRRSSSCLKQSHRRPSPASNWQGMPQIRINQGDVVGLLLDLGQRTLSVYLNGARRGVMVAPGMKKVFGEAVVSLAGPLRWAVDVFDGASVHIQRRPAPGPVPSAEEVAAAVAWNKATHRWLNWSIKNMAREARGLAIYRGLKHINSQPMYPYR
jgi:hypothetical protein